MKLYCLLQLLFRAVVFFHLDGVPMPTVASFSPSNNNNHNKIDPMRVAQVKDIPSLQTSNNNSNNNDQCILPASSRVCLEFLKAPSAQCSETFGTGNANGSAIFGMTTATEQTPPLLFLTRRDGVHLYGREIVHTESDARAATMAFLSSNGSLNKPSLLWDATLVIQPDRERISEGTETACQSPLDSTSSSSSSSSPSSSSVTVSTIPTLPATADAVSSGRESSTCFVAMNRFQVKEDCKSLFEERWAQRQSKLSYQPGFLGFALLRRDTTPARTLPTTGSIEPTTQLREEYNDDDSDHRFNYSTCTIWDSECSWERWRSGTGKSSHEANRQVGAKKRVPVSEWLDGPSSPIFWDGKRSIVRGSRAMEMFVVVRQEQQQLSP